ncbi:MAG TPA: lamin tail domain-containing protein [Polyangiaceae bacterium]|nr:lamin tail domain-containing protein [Polyangiaceae bacterium]
MFAPAQRLFSGETYSVGVLGYGILGSFVVRVQSVDYAVRMWPPSFAPDGGKRWVFCGTGPLPPPGEFVYLEPASVTSIVAAGADSFKTSSDRCFRLEAMDDARTAVADASRGDEGGALASQAASDRIAVPPPLLDGIALDPSPVVMDAPETADASDVHCDDGTVALGPGCARVLDDRVIVRNGASPLLWVLSGPTTAVVVAARPGEELALGGLTPGARVSLRGTATDLAGDERVFSAVVTMLPPEPHLVLNEVLANPNGADRTSEWVELVNDGTTAVETGGWSLEDSTRGSPLPRGTLAPGAYALVVPEEYDPSSDADVPPAEGTLILRVHELGGGGLSNQGEALRLRDPNGAVVSQFPALAATKAGVSMARRAPASADDDATAFGASAPPGASPGAPNVLADP